MEFLLHLVFKQLVFGFKQILIIDLQHGLNKFDMARVGLS